MALYSHTRHAPGHVSLWREGDGTLIAGDAFVTTCQESATSVFLQTEIISGPPKYFTCDWLMAENSVKDLAGLSPHTVVTGQSAQSGDKNKRNQAARSIDQNKQKTAKTTGKNQSTQSAGQSNQNISEQIGSKNRDMKPGARPGGATHENANDVGKYSEKEDSKSMLNSKKAIAERKKNLTEPDTTLKKGSGSARKNMKNHTGKTGNYRNQESRHNQANP